MLKIRLLVISFVALCLSVAPVMADFVDLTAYDAKMTVTATNTTIVDALYTPANPGPGGQISTMNIFIKEDDGTVQQLFIAEPYDLTATLVFTGSGNDYSATGSLVVNDAGVRKIAADFVSTILTFDSYFNPWAGTHIGTLNMTGYLTTQENETSILLGDSPWEFGTISLSDPDPSLFTHGNMIDFHYDMQYETLQEFLAVVGADGSGLLNAQIYSTPIPAAILLGIVGLGVAGLKLRKHA